MSDEHQGTDEVENILEGVQGGIQTGAQVAGEIERIADGDEGAPMTASGLLEGIGSGLDVGADVLGELGVPAAVVEGIETIGQIAPVMGAAVEAIEALVDAGQALDRALRANQRRVEYDIELAQAGWRVSEVLVTEELGAPYRARVIIRTADRSRSSPPSRYCLR